MVDPVCEEGFLVVESENGGLLGRGEFYAKREEAEARAKAIVQNLDRNFPVLIVPVARLITEEIRSMRGPDFL
jgi:hypothetical protein